MAYLASGMTYWEFPASTLLRATVHVARISPAGSPFVIGSITNQPNPREGGATDSRTRLAISIRNRIGVLSRQTIRVDATTILSPVWISNGTFFSAHGIDYPRVLGTIVHLGIPVVSVTEGLFPGNAAKARRWYCQQYRSNQFSRLSVDVNSPVQTATQLVASSRMELLGGAGLFVSGGNLPTLPGGSTQQQFWESANGGDFDNGQTYSSGPIVARTPGPNPVYYTIIIRGVGGEHLQWSGVASYLLGAFNSDLRIASRFTDPLIREACVYDGGASRQLWIHNHATPLRFSGVKVPNYLCVWGQLPPPARRAVP